MQVQGSSNDREKILFVIDHFRNPNAGTEGQLFQLIQGLDRNHFTPYLLVFSDSDYLQEYGFPCEYEVLGHSRLSAPATWLALWSRAKQYKASGVRLAHVFFNDPSVICPPIFRFHRIKTIISRRDMGYWYTPAYRALLLVTGRFVSAVITNSQAVRQVTARKEGFPRESIHVVYNGYDSGGATPKVPSDLLALRKRNPEAIFAGLVANIRPIKRIGDAIVALTLSGVCKVHLVVIGAGDANELKALAKTQGVGDRVHFLGGRSDVKACLAFLDIALLCSESEGFSNAIIEYMQAGVPVICSEVGGNPEAVIHGETGFLYACGDIRELGRKLAELASDAEMRKSIGDNARKVAKERFGMDEMVSRHELIYRRISRTGE